MRRPRRSAFWLLLAGLVLALGTPAWVAYAAPDLAGYLLHPTLFLGQAVPYLLCGALWLPWRAPRAAAAALALAAVLLLTAVIVYVPIILAPGASGGDMIGLAYVAISGAMTGEVLVGSAVALVVLRLRSREA